MGQNTLWVRGKKGGSPEGKMRNKRGKKAGRGVGIAGKGGIICGQYLVPMTFQGGGGDFGGGDKPSGGARRRKKEQERVGGPT